MKYIIRAKAVSECLGIRRRSLCYFENKDGIISLLDSEHPLKNFKEITVLDGTASVNGVVENLKVGEDTFFYQTNKVMTNGKKVIERITLGLMILPLDIQMKDYYLKAIEDGYLFDEWDGEFEYLLSMMYDLDQNDEIERAEYLSKAENKKFLFRLKK